MIDDFYEQTAVVTYPVSLAEVKLWCKLSTSTVEDTLLNSLITAATEAAEKYTNRLFISRTVTGYYAFLDGSSDFENGYFITLRRAPVTAVTTVKVYVDDVLTTIEATEYNLKQSNGGFSRIVFETAIKETIANWYQNRGDCGSGSELPSIAKGILGAYRISNTFSC